MTAPDFHPDDDPQHFFQPSYAASRRRLLAGLRALAPRHDVLLDSRALTQRGPQGETLALDFAIVGSRRPAQALVLSSGTHGVEGYTGSALQHWVLDRVLPALRLPRDTAVILQHANNPWGFAWHRRVNEHNVDINRNFLERFDPQACPPDYDALFEAMNPPDLDPARDAERLARMQAFIAEHGFRRFQTMFSEGQYKHPTGLQFGGQALQPGPAHLLALVREHLAQARIVIWLDIHTGLGASGACELITGDLPDTEGYRLANSVWGGVVKSANGGESVSPPLNGLMDQGLARALPVGCRAAIAYAEYGTHPPERVMAALRADNCLHHHGGPADLHARVKTELLEVFRPDSRDWERQVLAHGAGLVRQALAALPGVAFR